MGLSRGESGSKPREIVFPSRFFSSLFREKKVLLSWSSSSSPDIRGDGTGKSGTRGREKGRQ